MTTPTVDHRQTLNLEFSTDADTLSRWLRGIPAEARISFIFDTGAKPSASDGYRLTATWSGSVG